MSKGKTNGMTETDVMGRVQEHEKKSTLSFLFIWVGMMICVPTLMIGAMLVKGLSIPMVLFATIVAFTVACLIMTLNGMQAADTGLPLTVLLGKIFGESGARYIASSVLAVTQIGWFAIQAAVCGSAFTVMMRAFGISFPVWLSSCIWGGVMVITAVYGFDWMKILNYIAVPLLLGSCLLCLFMSFNQYGMEPLHQHIPDGSVSFTGAVAMLIGFFANCMLIVCDITRYAKDRKAVVVSSFAGVIPATLVLIVIGGILGIIAGTADMSIVFSDMGLPVVGALALIVAAWTSNSTTVYSAGLAVLRITNLKDDKRTLVTAIAGIIGTVMAAAGIMNQFEAILNILSVLTPPIAGIMIADYWIIGKGKKESWRIIPAVNWSGIISWACGTLVGMTIQVGSAALNSVVVSLIIYLIIEKVREKRN